MVTVFSRRGKNFDKAWRNKVIERYNNIFDSDIELYYADGVPYLTGGKYISVTHTDVGADRIEFIAVGDLPVGIDAESDEREVNIDIAKRFFTESEAEYIGNDNKRFLEVWRKKESFGKRDRIGFSRQSILDTDCFGEYRIYNGVVVTVCSDEKQIAFLTADIY